MPATRQRRCEIVPAANADERPSGDNTNDQHDEFIFADFVKNTTTTEAKPAQTRQVALQCVPETRGVRQPVDSDRRMFPVRPGHTLPFFGGASPNLLRNLSLRHGYQAFALPWPSAISTRW